MTTTTQTSIRSFGDVDDNPIGLEKDVTVAICEGFNLVYASFQALYLQYQKHHFMVEGAEFYSIHEFFQESCQQPAVKPVGYDGGLKKPKS